MPKKMDFFLFLSSWKFVSLSVAWRNPMIRVRICVCVCVCERDWVCTEAQSNGACLVYAAVAMDFSYKNSVEGSSNWSGVRVFFPRFLCCVYQTKTQQWRLIRCDFIHSVPIQISLHSNPIWFAGFDSYDYYSLCALIQFQLEASWANRQLLGITCHLNCVNMFLISNQSEIINHENRKKKSIKSLLRAFNEKKRQWKKCGSIVKNE